MLNDFLCIIDAAICIAIKCYLPIVKPGFSRCWSGSNFSMKPVSLSDDALIAHANAARNAQSPTVTYDFERLMEDAKGITAGR